MECRKARETWTAYLDGIMALEEKRAVDAHLQGCFACRQDLGAMRRVVELGRDVPEQEPPADLPDRVMAAVGREPRLRNKPRLAPVMKWVVSAAAVVLLMIVIWPRQEKPEGDFDDGEQIARIEEKVEIRENKNLSEKMEKVTSPAADAPPRE